MQTYSPKSSKANSPHVSKNRIPPSLNTEDRGSTVGQNVAFDFRRISIFPSGPAVLQPKLEVGRLGDRYEQEADRVSEQLSGVESPARSTHTVSGPVSAPPLVQDVLRSSGQPLPAHTRRFMESGFHHDFSRVRIHSDERATRSAEMIGARAYTVGNDIVFGKGQPDLDAPHGRRLLAHELTHVAQQSRLSGNRAARPAGRLSSAPQPYVAREEGIEGETKNSIWYKAFDPAVFDKPFTDIDGKEIGRMRLLGMQADVGLGARLNFVALKVEAKGRHVHAEQSFLAAGAELGVSLKHRQIEAGAEAVIVEGKVGLNGAVAGVEMKGSFVLSVGVGAEFKLNPHHFKLGAKALIGFEIEFGAEDVEAEPPEIDLPSPEEDVSMKVQGTVHEEMPKPKKTQQSGQNKSASRASHRNLIPGKKRVLLKGEVPLKH
jgi:hypothetical protein